MHNGLSRLTVPLPEIGRVINKALGESILNFAITRIFSIAESTDLHVIRVDDVFSLTGVIQTRGDVRNNLVNISKWGTGVGFAYS